jgi:hypothetical protein
MAVANNIDDIKAREVEYQVTQTAARAKGSRSGLEEQIKRTSEFNALLKCSALSGLTTLAVAVNKEVADICSGAFEPLRERPVLNAKFKRAECGQLRSWKAWSEGYRRWTGLIMASSLPAASILLLDASGQEHID